MASERYFRLLADYRYSCGEPPPGSPARDILGVLRPRGVPVAPKWLETYKFRWLDRDVSGRYLRGDFFHRRELNMLRRAYDVLHPLLQPHGEFLPIVIGKDPGFVYNVLEMVDCVEAEASLWLMNADGHRRRVRKPAFRRHEVRAQAFMIPELNGDYFVSNTVRDLVLAHDLKGWLFEPVPFADENPVWDDT